MNNLPIGITMGDPFGIGPEIIIKAYLKKYLKSCVVYGDKFVLSKASKLLGHDINIITINSNDIESISFDNDSLYVVNCCNEMNIKYFRPGTVSSIAGYHSYMYVETAVKDAINKKINSIVTSPLSKEALFKAGIKYPGHTEILAELTNTKKYAMLMINDLIKVMLVTIHVPIVDIPNIITIEKEIDTIRLAYKACNMMSIENPHIAVAGLNPHAGENGIIGTEEIDIIKPAIEIARNEGILLSGPLPGDTIFMMARLGKFDMVVAQYHDQGLIPIKYLGIDHGVNVTIGLPFLRTSVDHGTAFDISWKNKANDDSLVSAIKMISKFNCKI
ncbi:4-hydroxythreonine-4-phosphate dehydrogenase [Candidatus Kinetoplastibacterium oncopeltii TCC290E]|uniref:4-hydroxythreonine-4-phosphate dehydrogenase n=1 Tax=Candidatus Kinetoplastidibacterium stringomonadis TCC290E TaxID=1208920 RepID=M1L704_9PROT|nr:4-hydroxythreonine-4-phosphate dehydrogenase PdxA [Candidatus Kinetoplastibacterium oncopeltii]AGF48363.1 4-hydroxythreonine-4-phosphate dehydrogenase [Candidatus Kinetoplastibacterium oncopeltii TCC290E]